MIRTLPLTLLLLSTVAVANQGDRYNKEIQNAKNAVTQSLNSSTFKSFTPNDYCADESCKAQIQNPKESAYFGNENQMVNDGTVALANDPNAKNLVDGYQERPKYKLDPNDAALQRAKGYMDDSYNITHGISSKYHDCEGGNVCSINPTTLSCQTPTNNTLSCYQEPVANIELSEVIYSCPSGWTKQGNTCRRTLRQCRYDNRNSVTDSSSIGGQGGHGGSCGGTDYIWNGNGVSPSQYSKGNRRGSSTGSCRYTYYEICGPVPQEMPATQSCSSGYTLSGGQCLKNIITWADNCPTMPTECTPKTPVCTEGAATKTINGVPTYLDCWKKRIDHQCELTDSCEPLLNPPESTYSFKETTTDISNCTQKTKTCGLEILGVCLSYDVSLECEKRDCENRNLVCGETSFCLDGDCYQGEGEQNENFSEAVAGLGALNAVAESFSKDTVKIFTGFGASCDKKPIGISDCCADDGWGNNIGLTECSAEEKGLAKAKEGGLTIELGQYCAEKVLGICVRKKKSYCQFDSKMARIIQEQGKVQLGLNFGTKKNPVCTGITPEQMQQLDFDKIDFSDFYEDMESNMELPDMDVIQDSIKDKFTDMEK